MEALFLKLSFALFIGIATAQASQTSSGGFAWQYWLNYLNRFGGHRNKAATTTTTARPARNEQCPCVQTENGLKCAAYNSRMAADSIEEAIINFADLTQEPGTVIEEPESEVMEELPWGRGQTTTGSSNGPVPGSGPNNFQTLSKEAGSGLNSNPIAEPYARGNKCANNQCSVCSEAMLSRLEQINLISASEKTKIEKELRVQTGANRGTCRRFNLNRQGQPKSGQFSNPASGNEEVNETTSREEQFKSELQQLVDMLKSGRKLEQPRKPVAQSKFSFGVKQGKGKHGRRQKRETSIDDFEIPQATLGTRYKITCVRRGLQMDENSKYVRLCDVCWVWRKLPEGYFPQYLNELTCTSRMSCLAGYGECNGDVRSVDVIRDRSNPDSVESIEVGTSCSCRIPVGSVLHQFSAL